jgi:hypothetical protein
MQHFPIFLGLAIEDKILSPNPGFSLPFIPELHNRLCNSRKHQREKTASTEWPITTKDKDETTIPPIRRT